MREVARGCECVSEHVGELCLLTCDVRRVEFVEWDDCPCMQCNYVVLACSSLSVCILCLQCSHFLLFTYILN